MNFHHFAWLFNSSCCNHKTPKTLSSLNNWFLEYMVHLSLPTTLCCKNQSVIQIDDNVFHECTKEMVQKNPTFLTLHLPTYGW